MWVVSYAQGLRVSDGQWLDFLGDPGQIFDGPNPVTVAADIGGNVAWTLVYTVPDDAEVGSCWEIVLDDGATNAYGRQAIQRR